MPPSKIKSSTNGANKGQAFSKTWVYLEFFNISSLYLWELIVPWVPIIPILLFLVRLKANFIPDSITPMMGTE